MCGIAGWLCARDRSPGAAALKAMTDAIAHRGPDGEGAFFAETRDGATQVALGNRRLAIIDLESGEQPIHSADGRYTIVYNGEIYNYRDLRDELEQTGVRFRTKSDTEVLLQAYCVWGADCLDRLRGMFAFAVWDAGDERLFLARDGFGKKPLFLYDDGQRLLFGSEIKSILAVPGVPRRLDRASVLDYLTYRYVPGPNTLFEGIRKLPPGSYAVWERGVLREASYYRPPDAAPRPAGPAPADPLDAFARTLEAAVRVRMVSDVPFGAYLSGGIDSSAVVALMSRHSDLPINTFAVGFDEARYSELGFARQVATRFKTNHHETLLSADHLMDHLPALIGFRDAPIGEPSDIPIYLLSLEAAKSVKMVLTGEGGDEVLAGYPKHRFEPWVAAYQGLVPRALHRGLVEPAAQALPYRFYRLKTLIANLGLRCPRERMPRWFGSLTWHERDRLAALDAPRRAVDDRPFTDAPGQSALRRILYFDQVSWLPDNLLERGDRMTMAGSIEARMPFLDRELVALVSGLPDRYRLRGGTQKWILRAVMRDLLPPDCLGRAKVGFRVPVNEWFQGPMRDYVYDHLTGPDSATRSFYHAAALERLLDAHVRGRQNHEKLIWGLLNLELFQRRFALA